MKSNDQKIAIAEKHGWFHATSTTAPGAYWFDPKGKYILASTEKYHRISEIFRIIRKRDKRFKK